MVKSEIKRAEHGGKIKELREKTGKNLLDFSVNLNPIPPVLTMKQNRELLDQYPDDTYSALKSIIARHHKRKPEEICVGNGSAEVIRTLCHTMIKPGDAVFIPEHAFGEYALSVQLAGGVVTSTSTQKTILSFLCNPDNPTGLLTPKNDIVTRIKEYEKTGELLCVDEAFIDLADPTQSVSGISSRSLFVFRSLTKSFSIPGLRFGYGLGDPDLITAMEIMRPPWSVNAIAEELAIQAFARYDELEQAREYIRQEREKMTGMLKKMGFKVFPSSTNFILFDTGKDVKDLSKQLLDHDIIIRDCSSFGLPTCIRVSVRTRDENKRLIEALSACLH